VHTSGTIGAVSWSADGSYTYDPDGHFEHLQAGSSATDTFTYTVSDGHGGTDTATVTITISGVNDPPVAADDNATTLQGTSVIIYVLDNDSDPDGDIFTLDSVGQAGNGTVNKINNYVIYTPSQPFEGIDTFTYTISDGHGGTDTATVTVTVTAAVVQGLATIVVTIDQGPTAPIYISTGGGWAIDEDTGYPVDGTHHVTSGPTHSITVAGGHYYCVWVGGTVTRYVNSCPPTWSGVGSPTACGDAAAATTYAVHFTQG
jgi:VCBS repeat-containing protein